MSAPDTPLIGDALLEGVSRAMVDLHRRYHHRAPVTARTQLIDGELLACVMGGVYTDVEKTMIEIQKGQVVQQVRSDFQTVMEHKFVEIVERLSGRNVVSFISNSHIGPDLEIEIFMLEPEAQDESH